MHLDLRLPDLLKLNEFIVDEWQNWVASAPNIWKDDEFLRKSMPIAVTSRYGQNQPICQAALRQQEENDWQGERRYDRLRYVTMALATHVR